MSQVKVKVLLPFVRGDDSFGVGETPSLPKMVAYNLAIEDSVEWLNKKAFNELHKQIIQEQEEDRIKQEEDEKKAAAILHKEELEDERTKLMIRVDDITNSLGDGADFYKTYAAHAEDLQKKQSESENDNKKADDIKKDGISQEKGE